MRLSKIPKLPKHRSFISELAYIGLNLGLAIGLFAVVLAIQSPLPAFALVLLGKWRMVAVRPRFWFANVQSNLVDIIVGLSIVVLLYYGATGSVVLQFLIAASYAVWLLAIKPRSKRLYIDLQAGIATFLGVTALFTVSYDWYVSIVVLFMWIIGYSSARHVLSHYREGERTFLAVIWGLIVAELGWVGYHWAFAYSLPGFGGVKLSQTAIIVLVLSFLAERVYDSYHRHEGEVQKQDVLLPAIFAVSVILVILLFFNTLSTGSI